MPGLYPRIKPYATHRIEVDSPHILYVEESGIPDGIPVLFVHGGPGAGTLPYHRTFFDPEVYRIILFDQRGAGQSTPHASLEHNNTQMLTTELQATLVELRTVLAGLSPDSQAYQSLNASLLELNRTLQNLGDFSRTLSDQPNSLVMPVDNPPDPIPEARSR